MGSDPAPPKLAFKLLPTKSVNNSSSLKHLLLRYALLGPLTQISVGHWFQNLFRNIRISSTLSTFGVLPFWIQMEVSTCLPMPFLGKLTFLMPQVPRGLDEQKKLPLQVTELQLAYAAFSPRASVIKTES